MTVSEKEPPDVEPLVDHICCECQQPFKAEAHHRVCPSCVESYMAHCEGDDDDEFGDECGLMHSGQCSMAGTEHCDFECQNRDSAEFAGSNAWMKAHGSACQKCGAEIEDGEEPGTPRECGKCPVPATPNE